MSRSLLSLVIAPLVFACGDTPNASPDAAPAVSGYFEHWLAEPQNCGDDPLFNCAPSVELCDDGTAIMLVTDIVNIGTYQQSSSSVTANFASGDVPNEIVFAVGGNGAELTDDWQMWLWTINPSPTFSSCQ